MSNVIRVDFKKGRYSLKRAREFLGSRFFREALFEWSLDELRATANHPEAWLTEAADAYEVILYFRISRECGKPCPVLRIARGVKTDAA